MGKGRWSRKKGRATWLKALLLHLDIVIMTGLAFLIAWRLGVSLPPWSFVTAGALLAGGYWLTYRIVPSIQSRRALSAAENMLGLVVVAVTPLVPERMVKVRGELRKAVSCDGSVEEGDRVEVMGIQGLYLLVQSVKGGTA